MSVSSTISQISNQSRNGFVEAGEWENTKMCKHDMTL